MSLSIACQCSCNATETAAAMVSHDIGTPALSDNRPGDASSRPLPLPDRDRGIFSYAGGLLLPLVGPPLRSSEVLHLLPDDTTSFETVTLSLYANGFSMKAEGQRAVSISWSPFSLVQACRLHSVEADAALPWLRLFKVSVFAHGATHFFATQGDTADTERARWVADIARGVRLLTLSLFPPFKLSAEPLSEAAWTTTRLLAGYLLLYDQQEEGVQLLYCELHAHWDDSAAFAVYEDETCDVQVMRLSINVQTCVSERVGVDCSCFSVDGHLFSTRTCVEKMLWLRAVSNVKVKLRHLAANPSEEDLEHYRSAVLDCAKGVRQQDDCLTRSALLPRRHAAGRGPRGSSASAVGSQLPPRREGPGFIAAPSQCSPLRSGSIGSGLGGASAPPSPTPAAAGANLGGIESPEVAPAMPVSEQPLLSLTGPAFRPSSSPLWAEPGEDEDEDGPAGVEAGSPSEQPKASGQPAPAPSKVLGSSDPAAIPRG